MGNAALCPRVPPLRTLGRRLEEKFISVAEDIEKWCRVFKYAAAYMNTELQPILVNTVEDVELQLVGETLLPFLES